MKKETMKHTPGPWKAHETEWNVVDEKGFEIAEAANLQLNLDWINANPDKHWGSGGEEAMREISEKEMKANMILLSAAPELLETLENITVVHKEDGYWLTITGKRSCQIRLSGMGPIVFKALSDWVEKRESIIAKAKGE